MNYLIWNGKDSRYIKGLVICEFPPISKPQMRVTETVIDGVDGSIIEELGYESYDKAVSIGLTQKADIDEISQYFSGTGEVVFSNEPNKYYKASIIGKVDYERLVRFKTATVTFRVQPFKYEYEEESTTLKQSATGSDIEITDAKQISISINGETTQDFTPSFDMPTPLDSVGQLGDEGIIVVDIATEKEVKSISVEIGEPLRSLPDGTSDIVYIENNFCRIERRIQSITLSGKENWGITNVDATSALFYLDLDILPKSASSCSSTHFVKTANYPVNSPIGIQIATNQRLFVRAPFTTLDRFKEWLSEEWVEVLYELEYPQVTEIVDKTGVYTIPEGSVTITNEEEATMKVSYIVDKLIAHNKGNCKSKPIITIKGTGYIELTLNGNKVLGYTFPDGEDTVIIDSQKQDAYLGAVLKNRNMTGKFPVFEIGENIVDWDGDVEDIEISSKSRWL